MYVQYCEVMTVSNPAFAGWKNGNLHWEGSSEYSLCPCFWHDTFGGLSIISWDVDFMSQLCMRFDVGSLVVSNIVNMFNNVQPCSNT